MKPGDRGGRDLDCSATSNQAGWKSELTFAISASDDRRPCSHQRQRLAGKNLSRNGDPSESPIRWV